MRITGNEYINYINGSSFMPRTKPTFIHLAHMNDQFQKWENKI